MKTVQNAHQSEISCLAQDKEFFYSGAQDGIVKTWAIPERSGKEEQKEASGSGEKGIFEVTKLSSQKEYEATFEIDAKSVNSICVLDAQNQESTGSNSFFTAGDDKSIKFWKRN